jgi:hypothetical protein
MGVDNHNELDFYGKAAEGASAVSDKVERVYKALSLKILKTLDHLRKP